VASQPGSCPGHEPVRALKHHWNKFKIILKFYVTFSAFNKSLILNIKKEVYNFVDRKSVSPHPH
jgi:hypothetical protein